MILQAIYIADARRQPPFSITSIRAVADSGRSPDAVFSGHVHSYQRFTRHTAGRDLPFVVAGAGGYAHSPKAMHKLQTDPDGSKIETPFKTMAAGVTLEAYNDTDPGFKRVTVDNTMLKAEYFLVPFEGVPPSTPADIFTLNWKTHKLANLQAAKRNRGSRL